MSESSPAPRPSPPERFDRAAVRAALRRITGVLPHPVEPTDLFALVLEEACRLLDAEAARIRLLVDEHSLTTAAFRGPADLERQLAEGEFEHEIRREVIGRRRIWHRPVVIDPSRPASQVAVPLALRDEVIGVLELWRCEGADFSAEGKRLLEMLANFATATLCGAALYNDMRVRTRQLEVIHEVQFLITAHRGLQEVLDTIVRTTLETFGARECTIRLVEQDESGRQILRVAAWVGRPVWLKRVWPLQPHTVDAEIMKGKSVAIEDLLTDPRTRDWEGIRERGLVSMLASPLRAGNQIIGGLRIYTDTPHVFTEEEQDLLESLAGQAAIAIENARLYHELAEAHSQLRSSFEELRTAQAELVKKEKLAALGELAALVAHEIRNPLTAIRGFAQRVKRRVDQDPTLAQACQIIVDEVDRLNKVIGDVLDFARRLEPKFSLHSLDQLLQDVLQLEGPILAERGIRVVTNCAPSLPPVAMDAAQMRQVLLNLITNARQAMHGEGTLTLTTRAEEGGIALDIADTGPGIPPEVQAKLFTPFFTTKTHGTGLGLTIARRIIQDHGGSLTYTTAPGQGTTFTIHLPVTAETGQ